ncbi:MAG: patatin-like phospholipase family protein [Paludibacter sp.]|nr:patatin-like phospholipase family protein [Paludibacter sp.]
MNNNLTLVLSGGGARGIAHIGVIEELERQGFTINSIAGTSMGSLIGGVYASGKLPEFKEWACNLDKHDLVKLIDFSFSRQGLVKGDKVLKVLRKFIPVENIEDLSIKYTATAFDLANNHEVVFREGNLFKAIRSSIAIPTVFTPVVSGKSVLLDGGLCNNIPISNAVRTENDTLVAVYVNSETPARFKIKESKSEKAQRRELHLKRIQNFRNKISKNAAVDNTEHLTYFDLINEIITTVTNNIALMRIEQYKPDVFIEVSREYAGTFDFYKVEELIEIGRLVTVEKLKELGIYKEDK